MSIIVVVIFLVRIVSSSLRVAKVVLGGTASLLINCRYLCHYLLFTGFSSVIVVTAVVVRL